ncbi:hypothetical protein IV203_004172 [Nitzschia inconspicua]|uniref:Uncharacterized protein n=1 Tax=Nitzschia inconspicua TaxID=303405 RepID=A0A9K3L4S6_9STRA|nr:hypothetical protein IV203_004172 [Nitzschia inconspicua]
MFLRTHKFSKNNRSSDGTPIDVPCVALTLSNNFSTRKSPILSPDLSMETDPLYLLLPKTPPKMSEIHLLEIHIDLAGDSLNGEEPKKPRGSRQLTNRDYDEHLEACLTIASKNKQALAPLRERLQARRAECIP